jgi:hypothetical protein
MVNDKFFRVRVCPVGRFMTASFSWFYQDRTKIYLSHPSLVIYFFSNPTQRTETGTAKRSEVLLIANHLDESLWWKKGRSEVLLIANHLDESLWLANKKQGAAIRSYLLHSSPGGAQLCCALYQPHQMINKYTQENNHFPKPKEYLHIEFSSSNFNVEGRISSTGGDALSAIYYLMLTTLTPS